MIQKFKGEGKKGQTEGLGKKGEGEPGYADERMRELQQALEA